MEPTTNNGGGKIITALIIGLLVGFTAGVFWQERRSNQTEKPSLENVKTAQEKSEETKGVVSTASVVTGSETATAISTLVVPEQVAGNQVTLQGLDATEVMWVAVREEKNGILGNILGASKVFVGNDQRITVELLRPTVSGNSYRVVLYRDVGTPDFNHKEDALISNREGRFIAK